MEVGIVRRSHHRSIARQNLWYWKGHLMSDQDMRSGVKRIRQRVGPTLRGMRIRRGLSLNELAEVAGISPSHLSRIERGLTVPSYEVLDHIANALGSDLSSLRSRELDARAIDSELHTLFDRLALDPAVQEELLGLSNETRQALAGALNQAIGPART